MWEKLLDLMLRDFVREGRLEVRYPSGATRTYGTDKAAPLRLTLTDPTLPRRIVLHTEMAIGEAYMDGTLQIEQDDIDFFARFTAENAQASAGLWWRRLDQNLRYVKRKIDQWNPAGRSKSNVAHHYDLNGALYDLFLDDDKQYSCAYFGDPAMTLEAAQLAKKRHIAGKLLLEPGQRVLDIGCGWGGMALTLAQEYGVEVLGVTLSEEQHKIACDRATQAGLADRVTFELRDYRALSDRFDRIVSVGMFEHVGVPHYRQYFGRVRDLLTDDGVALIHTIGRQHPPGSTSPWIAKYIFPGGYVPALSEAAAAIEKEGLVQCDLEIWRLHYAETLRHWCERFEAQIDAARALYDDRFCRMWRYYLRASEHTFRHGGQVVFQFQLARAQTAVPLTRDYLYPSPAPAHLSAAE